MTETERETELVAGVVGGIIQKPGDKWQIEVKQADSQYAKKIWTKSKTFHEAATALIGQQATFLCKISHWEQDGEPRKSLWLDTINPNGSEAAATPPDAPQATPAPHSGTPAGSPNVTEREKQQSIERQTALKAAVEHHAARAITPNQTPADEVLATAVRFAGFLETGLPMGPEPF